MYAHAHNEMTAFPDLSFGDQYMEYKSLRTMLISFYRSTSCHDDSIPRTPSLRDNHWLRSTAAWDFSKKRQTVLDLNIASFFADMSPFRSTSVTGLL